MIESATPEIANRTPHSGTHRGHQRGGLTFAALLIAVASAGAPPSPAEATSSWYQARPQCLDEEAALSHQGFTRTDIRKAAWIAWRESGCGRDLINERTQDWGHWQFHWAYWRTELCKARIACDRRQLLDLRSSARAVKYAHQKYGWKPWCYQKCPWQ